MGRLSIQESINMLGADFPNLHWNFQEQRIGGRKEYVSQWLGEPDEDIMVCAFKGKEIHETFHRQDFFFINYAYTGDYGAQSYRFNNHVTVRENECYIGQPFSGYALYGAAAEDIVILGVLVKKEVFYRNFLKPISSDSRLLHFFLDPQINSFSDECIHLCDLDDEMIRTQFELMAVEYADRKADTQDILKPMTLTLIMMIARQYRDSYPAEEAQDTTEKMVRFMEDHLDNITLSMLASEFGYHPSYISAQLSEKRGETFSQILLNLRMERAVFLMRNTDLSIEEITPLIGYNDKSNFHKAFREYYGKTPRQFMESYKR
jgi:AraC-like DNA-binding protein